MSKPHETARPSGGSLWASGPSVSTDTSETSLVDEEQGNMLTPSNATPPQPSLTGRNSKGRSIWKDEDDEVDSEPPAPNLTVRHAKPFPPASDGGGGSSPPMSYMYHHGDEDSRPTLTYPPQVTPPRQTFLTGKHAKELPNSATPSMFVDDEVDIDHPPDDDDVNDGDSDASAISLTYPGGRPFTEPDKGSGPQLALANPAKQSTSANGSVYSRSNERRRSIGAPESRCTPERKSQTSRPEGYNYPAVLPNPILAKLGRTDNNGSGSQFISRGSVTSAGLASRHASNLDNDDGASIGDDHVADTCTEFSSGPQSQPRRASAVDRPSSSRRNSVTGSGFSLDSFQPQGGTSSGPPKSKRPRHTSSVGVSARSSVGSFGAAGEKRLYHAGAIDGASSRGSSMNSFTNYLNTLLSREAAAGPRPSFKKDGFRKWFGPWFARTVLSIKGLILGVFLISILSCCMFLGYYQAASDRNTLEMLVNYLQMSSADGVRNAILNRATVLENFTRTHASYFKRRLWTTTSMSQPGAAFWSSIILSNIPDLYVTQNALAPPYTGSLYGAEVYGPNVMLRWSAPNTTHTLVDYYDFQGNLLSDPPSAVYQNYNDQSWVTQLFPLTRDKAELGHWTGVILYNGGMYISFSVPIYAADNATIQYTMGADFTLDFLSAVAEGYKSSDPLSPEIVILDSNGSIVASTFPDTNITTTPPGGGDPVLFLAANSPTPAVRAANSLMLAATPDHTYNTLTNPIVEQVETMSGSMFVTALPCTTDTGIRLIVMQFQRRATIFDPIDQASNTTALVVAAFVVGMVVITMLLLHWVTKPLLIIQQAMNDLFVDHGHEEESAVSRQSTATGSGKKQAAGAGTSVPVQATAQMEDDAELGESRSQPFDRQQPAVRPKTAKAKRLSSLKQLSRLSEISDLQISFMKMKETIRAFERFVPPVVVQRIIARENKSKELYVEKKEVAIFFSDIQDFTNIAERVHSEVLISMLAQYFEEMTRAIERSHGVLCDFIGDGLMIFWNAPKPLDDFPTRALDCALDQQARVSKLNTAFRSQGWPEFIVRMAVHVGTVHAGNVGSRHRMKLGIVGDNVNLASRLEGLNKRYSSRVIISDDCRRALRKPETYLMRPLESVIVKGRSQSVDVYEVFGHLAVQPAHTVEMVEAYGVVHQMVGAINPQRSAKRDKETVAAACDAYNAKYPKDQMGQLLREKVVRGTFGQPLAMNEK
ncbi:hypothetical protein HDU90_001581 [Geranomyces variabilis]|nr:hypothetical protein HDU90_001581 [Geranomyces variabilis]